MGMLSEAAMKIKPDDVKQKSMTYSSESEDLEHSLPVSSFHIQVEAYIRL